MESEPIIQRKAPQAEREVDRLRIVILAIGTLYLPWVWSSARVWPWLATALLAVGWAYVALLARLPIPASLRRSYLTASFDGLLTLGWVLATGGADSPFFSLLLVTAFAAAVRFRPSAAWWVAASYSAGYLLLLIPRGQLADRFVDALLQLGVLFAGTYFAAVVSGLTVRQALEKEALDRERHIQQARRELLVLLESTQDAVVGLDANGHITTWNRGAERLTGLRREDAVGQSVAVVLGGAQRPVLEELLQEARSGKVRPPFEMGLASRDGAEHTVSVSVTPVTSAAGELLGLSMIGRDITEAKNAERLLRRSQHQLEEAQRLAHVGSFEWDKRSDRASWSVESYRMLGLDPAQFQPSMDAWRALIHPEDRPRVDAAVQQLLEQGGTVEVEHRIVRPSGEVRWVRDRAEGVRSGAGEVVMLRGTTQDITEQRAALESSILLAEARAARAAAEEALRIRDEFLTVAAHELRTPVTTLKLQVQSLLAMLHGREPERMKLVEKLQRVERQTGHLGQLIESLLDVSRVAEGRLELHLSAADLTELARHSVERFSEQGASSGSPIQLVESGPVHGQWDPLRVEQVIDNLLSNAIKYGGGRPVLVEVGQRDDFGFLVVRDRGISIPRDEQERIFGRFERAAPSRHFGGLGLGLWLVREVVEAMGGSISVQSEPGEGSAFTVILPLRPGVEVGVQLSPSVH